VNPHATGWASDIVDLWTHIYSEVHAAAHRFLRRGQRFPVFQTSDVVSEVYLRLAHSDVDWKDRKHFMCVLANTVRRVIIDRCQHERRQRRGGGRVVSLEDLPEEPVETDSPVDLIALGDALDRLEVENPRAAIALSMRMFGGFRVVEIAESLGCSRRSVDLLLAFSRARISCFLDN